MCLFFFFFSQFEDIFVVLVLLEDICLIPTAFSVLLLCKSGGFFLCCCFIPWKVEGGVEGKVFSRNPQVAQRSSPSQITAAGLGSALQLSILEASSPCLLSVCSSCPTVAIQTLQVAAKCGKANYISPDSCCVQDMCDKRLSPSYITGNTLRKRQYSPCFTVRELTQIEGEMVKSVLHWHLISVRCGEELIWI